MAVSFISAIIVYAKNFPEYKKPGYFDYIVIS